LPWVSGLICEERRDGRKGLGFGAEEWRLPADAPPFIGRELLVVLAELKRRWGVAAVPLTPSIPPPLPRPLSEKRLALSEKRLAGGK
jgi:hypothetical protein